MISGVSFPRKDLCLRSFIEARQAEDGQTFDNFLDAVADNVRAEPQEFDHHVGAALGRSIRVSPKDQHAIADGLQKRGITAVHTQQNVIATLAASVFCTAMLDGELSSLETAPRSHSRSFVEPTQMGL